MWSKAVKYFTGKKKNTRRENNDTPVTTNKQSRIDYLTVDIDLKKKSLRKLTEITKPKPFHISAIAHLEEEIERLETELSRLKGENTLMASGAKAAANIVGNSGIREELASLSRENDKKRYNDIIDKLTAKIKNSIRILRKTKMSDGDRILVEKLNELKQKINSITVSVHQSNMGKTSKFEIRRSLETIISDYNLLTKPKEAEVEAEVVNEGNSTSTARITSAPENDTNIEVEQLKSEINIMKEDLRIYIKDGNHIQRLLKGFNIEILKKLHSELEGIYKNINGKKFDITSEHKKFYKVKAIFYDFKDTLLKNKPRLPLRTTEKNALRRKKYENNIYNQTRVKPRTPKPLHRNRRLDRLLSRKYGRVASANTNTKSVRKKPIVPINNMGRFFKPTVTSMSPIPIVPSFHSPAPKLGRVASANLNTKSLRKKTIVPINMGRFFNPNMTSLSPTPIVPAGNLGQSNFARPRSKPVNKTNSSSGNGKSKTTINELIRSKFLAFKERQSKKIESVKMTHAMRDKLSSYNNEVYQIMENIFTYSRDKSVKKTYTEQLTKKLDEINKFISSIKENDVGYNLYRIFNDGTSRKNNSESNAKKNEDRLKRLNMFLGKRTKLGVKLGVEHADVTKDVRRMITSIEKHRDTYYLAANLEIIESLREKIYSLYEQFIKSPNEKSRIRNKLIEVTEDGTFLTNRVDMNGIVRTQVDEVETLANELRLLLEENVKSTEPTGEVETLANVNSKELRGEAYFQNRERELIDQIRRIKGGFRQVPINEENENESLSNVN